MKTGVIDVGGGMRGIYAAGVLDTCLEDGVHFQHCIGISAGSANLASFLGCQKGRNYRFYHDYSRRKAYMGAGNLLRRGSFLDLEYIYGTLSNAGGEDPLNFRQLSADQAAFQVIASNALTGEAKIFDKSDMAQDNYRILMASSCVPGVDRPILIDGVPYYDGALADPVPVELALEAGCDRLVLLLTKPLDLVRKQGKDKLLARMIRRKYPRSAENMLLRAQRYNDGIARAQALVKEGRALIVAPSEVRGVSTLKGSPETFDALYDQGRRDGRAIGTWLAQQ